MLQGNITPQLVEIETIKTNVVLAIVGYRFYNDWDDCIKHIGNTLAEWKLPVDKISAVVSGGAMGADKLAERFAKSYNLHMIVYKPDWKKHGRAAGILRNSDIINACTHCIAFPSPKGKGTQDSIKKAQQSGKVLKVIEVCK